MTQTRITPSNGYANNNEVLLELPKHKNRPGGLKDASPELMEEVCRRWGNCDAFETCKAHCFLELCDCRVKLSKKVEWNPTEQERPIDLKQRHQQRYKAAIDYFYAQTTRDRKELDGGGNSFEIICEDPGLWWNACQRLKLLKNSYNVDIMQEAEEIVHGLKIADNGGN